MKLTKVSIILLISILSIVYLVHAQDEECPLTGTKCLLNNGTNTCCPIKNAVCCHSGDYCCPKGFQCDLNAQQCVKDEFFIPFYLRLKALDRREKTKTENSNDVMCPDNETTCKEKQTCCPFQDGKYGCCILPEAVCCDDLTHCCPKHYTCNPSKGKCDRSINDAFKISIDWSEKQPGSKKEPEKNIPCPDGKSQCPDGNTCCQLASGQYGCCPLPKATCCSDHIHCCPNGYKCDVKDGRCLKGGDSIPFYKKTESIQVNSVVCPDQKSRCPDGATCCLLASGQYGCCPLPEAVCCSDRLHCCPNGYTCDTKESKCNKGYISIPFFKKFEVTTAQIGGVLCPGGTSECPNESTCCQLESGEWGCCPLPNAVCCDDHEHCCPNGYKCDTKDGRCIEQEISIPFYKKTEAELKSKKVGIVCPDQRSECPNGSTCCKLASGQYGCCPLPNAVCCSDHLHCCPHGYTCDVKDGRCNNGTLSLPFLKKLMPVAIEITNENNLNDINCDASGSTRCPTGSTCCKIENDEWGCCPLTDAVCCDDGLHCCPNGYTCDVKKGACFMSNAQTTSKIPFYKKFKPIKADLSNVISQNLSSVLCPDGISFCPNSYTCCLSDDQGYACCPLKNAVCCEDHLHCCPEDTQCDIEGQCCVKRNDDHNEYIPWSAKLISKMLFNSNENSKIEYEKPLICENSHTTCPPMSTCCQQSDNSYACCPYEDGVCCSELNYCCPKNTKCGTKVGECIQKDDVFKTNWHRIELKANKNPTADYEKIINEKFLCPGGITPCTNGTCCQKPDSTFSCCPYFNGTCCGTHGYCCPQDYTCDSKVEACIYNDDLKKLNEPKKFSNCGTGKHKSYTKCSNNCCPLPYANCCGEDTKYCCPSGFKCNLNSTAPLCERDNIYVSAVKKLINF